MFPYDGYSKLATELAMSQDEASMRSAVSRAYYASMHKSRIFAENGGKIFESKGTPDIHKEVVDYYKYKDSMLYSLVATKLGRLRTSRNECDYNDNIKNVKSITENAILDLKDIFGYSL